MLRPKSGVNWKGTIYGYDKKRRNSCFKCNHCKGGFCDKQNVDIEAIGSSFYKYCKHYVNNTEKKAKVPDDKKILDATLYNLRKMEEKQINKVKLSVNCNQKKIFENNQNCTSDKSSKRDNTGRYHEKTVISRNEKVIKSNGHRLKSVVLRKILDDSKVTVKFVEKVSFETSNSSIFEATILSSQGRAINRAKIGTKIEFNGYRCIVEAINYK